MKIDEISALLEKYQKGNCTPEEKSIIDEWYESLQLGEGGALPESVLDNSLDKIHARLMDLTSSAGSNEIRSAETGSLGNRSKDIVGQASPAGISSSGSNFSWERSSRGVRLITIQRWANIAAVLMLLTAGTWWFFQKPGTGPLTAAKMPDTVTTIITGKGETRQIVLPDGSCVQLNAATELSYPRKFQGHKREVTLVKGEAFFQIAPRPDKPFVVLNGVSRTTVLGTSFDIRAYDEEGAIKVALLTGKITYTPSKGALAITLAPHQMINVNKSNSTLSTLQFDNDVEVAAWKEGAIRFKDASFEDIAFEISNKYNIDLINVSKKRNWSYTGLFRNSSLQETIETICQTENLGFQFTENQIRITDKNQ